MIRVISRIASGAFCDVVEVPWNRWISRSQPYPLAVNDEVVEISGSR
jgi:hypothetical protein